MSKEIKNEGLECISGGIRQRYISASRVEIHPTEEGEMLTSWDDTCWRATYDPTGSQLVWAPVPEWGNLAEEPVAHIEVIVPAKFTFAGYTENGRSRWYTLTDAYWMNHEFC